VNRAVAAPARPVWTGAALLAAMLALLLAFAATSVRADPTFPPLTGRVVDDAHVLSDQTVSDLTQKLADLETKTGRQLVVVTLPSLQGYEIEDYGYQLGRAWGIGQKGQDNGALLIIAPTEHKVRIEVGYGLEPILTDALSNQIIQSSILPKFRTGDFNGGAEAGTDAIIAQLSADAQTQTANVQQAATAAKPQSSGLGFGAILGLVIFFFVISSLFRGMGWFLPMMILGSGSRGGGWGGGGWSGGGGGGFSGGGGSFGGGGASGGW
jgi:uncharacterized protein